MPTISSSKNPSGCATTTLQFEYPHTQQPWQVECDFTLEHTIRQVLQCIAAIEPVPGAHRVRQTLNFEDE